MAMSQAQQADPRLEEAFGASKVSAFTQDSIQFYSYILENGFEVMELPDDKRNQLPMINQLQMKNGSFVFTSESDLENFNRLLVSEPANKRLSQTFQIPNSTKALVLPSMFQLKLMAKDEL